MGLYEVTLRGEAWRESYRSLLGDPENALRGPDVRILQRSERTTVARIAARRTELVLKLFRRTSAKDRLEAVVLGSRAARVAKNIRRMRHAGFATPRLVAVLEKTPLGTGGRSCVVTRAVEGERADVLWARLGTGGRIAFARQLGSYMRELHAKGLYPQDTRAANFIVAEGLHRSSLVLVDLYRVRLYRSLSWPRRQKNLVQIHRSLGLDARGRECVEFLTAYLGDTTPSVLQKRTGAILRAAARKNAARAARS
jgi:hypothetical protein